MTEKELIHLLGNFIGQLPTVEKSLKTLVISFLSNYQQLLIQQQNNLNLNKELLEAYRYIEKLEDEKNREGNVN